MNPLVFVTVVLLVWVFMLMAWIIHQEVRLRAQQQAQMRLHAMFTQDLANERRERALLMRYLNSYVQGVARAALPPDVWIRIEREASGLLEEG